MNACIIAVPVFLIQLGMIANWGPRLALERRSIGGTGLRGLWTDLWKESKKMQWLGRIGYRGGITCIVRVEFVSAYSRPVMYG